LWYKIFIKMKNIITLVFALMAMLQNTNAQTNASTTIINEGKITYDVYMNGNIKESQGKLIITIKNENLKREMIMNNGFYNLIIKATDGNYIYSDVNGNKFVKKITNQELVAQNLKFENASYNYGTSTKTIANQTCNEATVTYKDGSKNTVFVSNDMQTKSKDFMAMFSQLKGLPLQYEINTNSNKITLIATNIAVVPIDDGDFAAPKGYKMVGN
jgi:hypothetical protein